MNFKKIRDKLSGKVLNEGTGYVKALNSLNEADDEPRAITKKNVRLGLEPDAPELQHDPESEGIAVEMTDEMIRQISRVQPEERFEKMMDLYKKGLEDLKRNSKAEIDTSSHDAVMSATDAWMVANKRARGKEGGTAKLDKAMRGAGRGKKFPAPKGPRKRK